VRTARWKYIQSTAGDELYDVRADPAESRNLVSTEAATRDRLRSAVAAWARAQPRDVPAGPVSDELRETLRSLGYLQ
jgi:hypothetical protein